MSEVEIGEFQARDLGGVLEVLGEAMHADAISEGRFTRQVLLDLNFRSEGAVVARRGGNVVGFCLAIARQVPTPCEPKENAASDADRGYITLLGVRAPEQRKGIGSQLLDRAEEYLRGQGRKVVMVSSYAPGYFIPGVDVRAYEAGLRFFAKHGYAEVYRPLAMEVSLWNWSVPRWVKEKERELAGRGVEVVEFAPRWTTALLEFARAEFPGDWVRVIRETAGKIVQGDSPARLLAAVEDGRVVAFSHFENERFGPIGVAAAQRGRCLGQVLMYRTLEAQRQAGFRVAWFLWSDDKTAERIYNGAGFRETRRFALLKKEL
jgi:mycothiol synthase